MYGCVFDVIVRAIHVRPWNAPSNAMTAWRFVYSRESFTAFSTGLRAGIEEGGALLAADRDERTEPLRELHVALVGDDRVVRVEEALGLLSDGFEHPRMVVADVRDADSADEVDERVAVDVRDRRSARAVGDDRLVDDQRVRDRLQLSLEDLAAPRAGDLRAYLDHAGGRHAREPR